MKISLAQFKQLFDILHTRFKQNKNLHRDINWIDVQKKLELYDGKLRSLYAMETTGGEPDVVGYDQTTGEYIFYDCSAESPTGRRGLCYDHEAWQARKENRPKNSAVALADTMGIELLTELQYRNLQELGTFDTKTSSWLKTPADIRELGGAIFADRRYGQVFVYHNGASSYYSSRGFRSLLRV